MINAKTRVEMNAIVAATENPFGKTRFLDRLVLFGLSNEMDLGSDSGTQKDKGSTSKSVIMSSSTKDSFLDNVVDMQSRLLTVLKPLHLRIGLNELCWVSQFKSAWLVNLFPVCGISSHLLVVEQAC